MMVVNGVKTRRKGDDKGDGLYFGGGDVVLRDWGRKWFVSLVGCW